jgi:hypothetical protein
MKYREFFIVALAIACGYVIGYLGVFVLVHLLTECK